MKDLVKVKVVIATNRVGSECSSEVEFEREDWEGMTDDQQEEVCQDIAFSYMEWYWEVQE